jgi:ABC-type nitrate/sulfonate/bicarbonate transport system permease component
LNPELSDHQSAFLFRILNISGNCALKSLPILIVAVLWELAARAGLSNRGILPTFSSVVGAFFDLLKSGEVLPHLFISIYRALIGLIIGSAAGIILGMLMANSTIIRDIIDPFVTLTFPLPKTAFIPIVLLWLGVGNASIILVVFLSTIVPSIISAYHGAQSVPKQYVWSGLAMGATRFRMFMTIVFPASLAFILNGIRIGLAFSMVVVISAEMVATTDGIGKFIFLFGESGNYNYMFAAILLVVGISFLLDQLFVAFSRWLLRWMDRN